MKGIDRLALLNTRRPSTLSGVLAVCGGVAAATLLVYPLKSLAPVVALGVVYLPVVVFVSMRWGFAVGSLCAFLSAAAFAFFQLPPVGRFELADGRNWVGLCAFLVVAAATGLLADVARGRAQEADESSRDAGTAAELAHLLLGAASLEDVLPAAGRGLAGALDVEHAEIVLGAVPDDQDAGCFTLRHDGRCIGALMVEGEVDAPTRRRIEQRVVPALSSILAAAQHRQELLNEVVEAAALRRSDEIKTAILRSVSHDLRTPVTAILTAIAALDADQPTSANASEVRELVFAAGTRLHSLIEKLLDLSRLEAGAAGTERVLCSLEDVLQEAVENTGAAAAVELALDPELPLVLADHVQLERAFANVLENSVRFGRGAPVLVRGRAVRDRLRILVVDQGSGITPAERERIFLPFYRAVGRGERSSGSGLGLTIAKGFIEGNDGTIGVESTPGVGTTFVIEFPAHVPIRAIARVAAVR